MPQIHLNRSYSVFKRLKPPHLKKKKSPAVHCCVTVPPGGGKKAVDIYRNWQQILVDCHSSMK